MESQVTKRNVAEKQDLSDKSKGDEVGPVGDNERKSQSTWNRLVELDEELTRKWAICASSQSTHGFLRPVMKLLEFSCHGIPWLTINAFAIVATHQIKTHEKLLNLFFALWFDLLVSVVLKVAFRRSRPSHNQNDMFGTVSVDKFSFPSGHATRAGMLACFLITHLSLGPVGDVLYVVWAATVCASRVLLGRHHVVDIVFGAAIGIMQYFVFINWLWMGSEKCEALIRPIQEELHL